MCFSPEADLAVGAVVVAIGVDALRHVRQPRQIPLASIPIVLGVHQLTETFVWWGLQGRVGRAIEQAALWSYLIVAFVVVPMLITVSVGLVERNPARRAVIAACAALAAVVAAALGLAILRGNISAAIEHHHLAYQVDALGHGGLLTELYIVATCGALLASSYRDLEILGVLNLVAVPVLGWLTLSGFVSLWCFWAAIVSLVIAFHLRRAATARGGSAPATGAARPRRSTPRR